MFGAVIARGEDYRQVFQCFHPGFDLDAARQARLDAGLGECLNGNDLYPDVRPCLHALKDAGYFVGIAGNQTSRARHFLRELNLPCDVLATSDDWGVTKPDVAFFSKLIAVSGHQPHEIAYVGDRLDNDLRLATEAGPHTVFVRRGPWGYIIYEPGTASQLAQRATRCPQDPASRLTLMSSCMGPASRRERRGCLNRRPTGDPVTSVGRPAVACGATGGEVLQEHQPAGLAWWAWWWLVVLDDVRWQHLSAALLARPSNAHLQA